MRSAADASTVRAHSQWFTGTVWQTLSQDLVESRTVPGRAGGMQPISYARHQFPAEIIRHQGCLAAYATASCASRAAMSRVGARTTGHLYSAG